MFYDYLVLSKWSSYSIKCFYQSRLRYLIKLNEFLSSKSVLNQIDILLKYWFCEHNCMFNSLHKIWHLRKIKTITFREEYSKSEGVHPGSVINHLLFNISINNIAKRNKICYEYSLLLAGNLVAMWILKQKTKKFKI